MQRLLKEPTTNTGYGIKGSTEIRGADKGRPMSFNAQPHVIFGY